MFACHILLLSTVVTVVVCNSEKQVDNNQSVNMCLNSILSSQKVKVPSSAQIPNVSFGGVLPNSKYQYLSKLKSSGGVIMN